MEKISFKSFLSHSYKSADINLYFFRIFEEIAEVQFEIDEGTKSTNVTRLEKLVRDSDAFIGIYPFSGTADEANNVEELKKQSRYFRLEMDLAFRSQKPAIIFYDYRFGTLIKPPGNVFFQSFDVNEVAGTGGFPNMNKHKNEFLKFCQAVDNKKKYFDVQKTEEKTSVAVVLSNDKLEQETNHKIREILENYNYSDVEFLSETNVINTKLFSLLEKVDFAIVDQAGAIGKSGLPAFFHGRFIPMIRVEKLETDSETEKLSNFLYNGVEVGYKKDKILWENPESFLEELTEKVKIYKKGVTRFNTYAEAKTYFLKAKLRKEPIFVSYSGEDIDIAQEIVASLKKHFQIVFDYRDGSSIRVGKPWQDEIFNSLAKSELGINLLSKSYFESGNCMHEAREMVAKYDSSKFKLFPIKLYNEDLELPAFFNSTQYKKIGENYSAEDITKDVLKMFDSD